MTRLSKADAERLLADYDRDPASALARALAVALASDADLGFDALVRLAHLPPDREGALLARDLGALDDLARELNEVRGLA